MIPPRDTPKAAYREKEALEANSRLIKTIEQTVEGLLPRANIRSKARSGVVQRIHDRKTPCCCQTIEAMFTAKNLPKSSFGLYFGNVILIESLKDKLKASVGKYRKQFVKLTRKKAAASLFAVNARETNPDAGVARHLSASDLRIGILGLNHQLDALDGRGERLRNGTKDSSEEEIGGQILEGQLLLRHAVNTVTVFTTASLSYF